MLDQIQDNNNDFKSNLWFFIAVLYKKIEGHSRMDILVLTDF